jgi:hypothetical protein
MRDVTVVLKYEIPAIRNSDFLTGNHTISTKQNNHLSPQTQNTKKTMTYIIVNPGLVVYLTNMLS